MVTYNQAYHSKTFINSKIETFPCTIQYFIKFSYRSSTYNLKHHKNKFNMQIVEHGEVFSERHRKADVIGKVTAL